MSDTYACRLERLPQVSYAAFGHIHRPQALPGSVLTGRYAGSPICLDYGEEGEQKEIVFVEAEPGRPALVTPQPLSGGRKLRTLDGTLDEIRAQAATVGDAICRVTIRTETPTENLSELLRELCPAATFVEVNEDCAATGSRLSRRRRMTQTPSRALANCFGTYLAEQGTRGANATRVLKGLSSCSRPWTTRRSRGSLTSTESWSN